MSEGSLADLIEIRVIGMLANMFSIRGVMPTEDQWMMLRGQREVTMRDIGEISHQLDMYLEFRFIPREADEEADTAPPAAMKDGG